MNQEQFEDWRAETAARFVGEEWYNGIFYRYYEMPDGWISIFEIDMGVSIPVIQAADLPHARSWCSLREPVPVPLQVIC